VACLAIFAYFADRLRRQVPDGYTLSDVMRERYGSRVQGAYLVQMVGLSCCAFAVQLLAGAAALSVLTGLPFAGIAVALTAVALSYSLYSGIRAAVVTDYSKIVIIYAVAAVVLPAAIYAAGGWHVVAAGFAGASHAKTNVFEPSLLMTFGVPVTIGLLSGPFGDQSFWQRAFAVRRDKVRGAFLLAACIFAVVPLSLSVLGFLAAGMGFTPESPQTVNIETVLHLLPTWMAVPFTFLLLAGLTSVLDDCMCSVSCLSGHDAAQLLGHAGDGLAIGRAAMPVLGVVGVAIACIPGLTILHLFLLYGTLRASTLLPTVLTILGVRLAERGVFWGIVAAIGLGLPVFAFGHLGGGGPGFVIAGSLLTVLSSGGLALALTAAERHEADAPA